RDGNCAISTAISSTTVQRRVACEKPTVSNLPSARRNAIRFSDARLQAVSSRNMYSEQGFEALMRPEVGQVCHSLIVVSYCTPGSAHSQAASPIFSHSSRAGSVFATLPSVRRMSFQLSLSSTAWMKALVMRTELFEFWPDTVR